jgi:alkylation response protein AidB-like acyl-CoA dehydrogenase
MNNDALAAARTLAPTILRSRNETEAARRLAEPIVAGLRNARLCRMALAEDVAGLAMSTPDMLDVYEALAYAEPSVAWIVWNNAFSCFFSRHLAPKARHEIFGDEQWLYGGSSRPTGKAAVDGDDYRVDGRWSLVSGCELAEWLMLMCSIEENGQPRMVGPKQPEMRFVFVRRGDFEILDTWHVGGLRGTGSHDVVVQGVRIPRSHTLSPAEPSTLDAPLGRIPIICSMAAGYGAQTLGIAQCSIDTLVELTKTKVAPDSGIGLRERTDVLESIVRHGAALDAARAYLRGCTEKLWETAETGARVPLDTISGVWAAGLHAADAALRAVVATYAAGGTTSLYTDCPLERAHRDIHAMLRHIVVQPFWLWDAGRVKLGIAPTHPLYAI